MPGSAYRMDRIGCASVQAWALCTNMGHIACTTPTSAAEVHQLETVQLTHANYFDGTVAVSKYFAGI